MPKYPYTSGQAALAATLSQLRKGAPAKVDAKYLKRFELATSNESYVISILRFLGLIAEDGTRIEDNTEFLYGDDDTFRAGMDAVMLESYAELSAEMGDDALSVGRERLVPWFRATDRTSNLVGGRQASTFLTIAATAGYGDVPTQRSTGAGRSAGTKESSKGKGQKAPSPKDAAPQAPEAAVVDAEASPGVAAVGADELKPRDVGVGLSVRIEVNLPAGGDSETYDAIFASIRKHLMS